MFSVHGSVLPKLPSIRMSIRLTTYRAAAASRPIVPKTSPATTQPIPCNTMSIQRSSAALQPSAEVRKCVAWRDFQIAPAASDPFEPATHLHTDSECEKTQHGDTDLVEDHRGKSFYCCHFSLLVVLVRDQHFSPCDTTFKNFFTKRLPL